MFPNEDSDIVSVRLSVHTPRKEITLASSISVVNDTSIERSSRVLQHEKMDFIFKKNVEIEF